MRPLLNLRPQEAPIADRSYDKETAEPQPSSEVDVEPDSDAVSLDAQPGVQDIEATTSVWPWSHVVIAYIL